MTIMVALAVAGADVDAQVPQDLAALDARKQEFIAGFVEPVKACVQRSDTSHPLFHGCIDWHSSVHGYWALTAAARLTGNEDLAAFVKSRLTRQGIALERQYVQDQPGFEMPYGRAWFLRLAIEFERAFKDERLRAMADDIAASLKAALESDGIHPLSSSYGSQSWALINLRAYGRHTEQEALVHFVDEATRARFLDVDAPCPADLDRRRRSFMAICTNWAWLVSNVLETEKFRAWLEVFLPDPQALEPVQRPANPHLYGLNFSRAWGLWRIYRHSGDARWLTLYRAHLEPVFDTPDWWRGDYQVVGHWVSQFGMFATVPLFEPDYY